MKLRIFNIFLSFLIVLSQLPGVGFVIGGGSNAGTANAETVYAATAYAAEGANLVANERTKDLVALVVEKSLYESEEEFAGLTELYPVLAEETIGERIDRYAEDIQENNELTDVKILLFDSEKDSSLDLIANLENLYFQGSDGNNNQLVGVVLIGEIPIPTLDKNGFQFSSVFPYTDFEDKAYDYLGSSFGGGEADSLVDGAGDLAGGNVEFFGFNGNVIEAKAEIWHGVIQSGNEEIAGFFDKNHLFYQKNPLYSNFEKKLFFGDLLHLEEQMNTNIYPNYLDFLEYQEDLAYNRYTKDWAEEITGDVLADLEVEDFDLGSFSQLPDIYAKNIIDQSLIPYFKVFQKYISTVNDFADYTGRYDTIDVQTFPALVSMKDEQNREYLKSVNQALEKSINEVLEQIQKPVEILDRVNLSGTYGANDFQIQAEDQAGIVMGVYEELKLYFHYFNEKNEELYVNGIKATDLESPKQCSYFLGSSNLVEAKRSNNLSTTALSVSHGVNTRMLSPEELSELTENSYFGNILENGQRTTGAIIESNNDYGIPAFGLNQFYANYQGPFERKLQEGDVVIAVNGRELSSDYTFDLAMEKSYQTVANFADLLISENLDSLESFDHKLMISAGIAPGGVAIPLVLDDLEEIKNSQILRANPDPRRILGMMEIEFIRDGQRQKEQISFTIEIDPGNSALKYPSRKSAAGTPLMAVFLKEKNVGRSLLGGLGDLGGLLDNENPIPDNFNLLSNSDGAFFTLYQNRDQGFAEKPYDASAGCNAISALEEPGRCFAEVAAMPVLDPAGSVKVAEDSELNAENIDEYYLNSCYSALPGISDFENDPNSYEFPLDSTTGNPLALGPLGAPQVSDFDVYGNVLQAIGEFVESEAADDREFPNGFDLNRDIWQGSQDFTADDIIVNNAGTIVTLKDFSDRYGLFDGVDNDNDGLTDFEFRDLDDDGIPETKWYDFEEASPEFGLPADDLELINRKFLSQVGEYTVPYSLEGFPYADFDRDITLKVEVSNYQNLEISSLILHNEPTDHTILEQVKSGTTLDLPIDDPRYVAFQSVLGEVEKVEYTNIFEDSLETLEDLESELREKAEEIAEIPGSYLVFGPGTREGQYDEAEIAEKIFEDYLEPVVNNVFDDPIDGFDLEKAETAKIIDALKWKNLEINEKHLYLLETVLDAAPEKNNYLDDQTLFPAPLGYQPRFGYEAAYLVVESEDFDGDFQFNFNQTSRNEIDQKLEELRNRNQVDPANENNNGAANNNANGENQNQVPDQAANNPGVENQSEFVDLADFLDELQSFLEDFQNLDFSDSSENQNQGNNDLENSEGSNNSSGSSNFENQIKLYSFENSELTADGETEIKVQAEVYTVGENFGEEERRVRFQLETLEIGENLNNSGNNNPANDNLVTFVGSNVAETDNDFAEIVLEAGTQTGKFKLIAEVLRPNGSVDPAYPKKEKTFELVAGEPEDIQINFENFRENEAPNNLNLGENLEVNISLYDQFGNLTTNSPGLISVFANDRLKILEEDFNSFMIGIQLALNRGKTSFTLEAIAGGDADFVVVFTDYQLENELIEVGENWEEIDFGNYLGKSWNLNVLGNENAENIEDQEGNLERGDNSNSNENLQNEDNLNRQENQENANPRNNEDNLDKFQISQETLENLNPRTLYLTLIGNTAGDDLLYDTGSTLQTVTTTSVDPQILETLNSQQKPNFSLDFGYGFERENKHMLLFSAGNNVGSSTLPNISELTLNLGDPLISLDILETDESGESTREFSENTGYDQTIGTQILNSDEEILEILNTDFNNDSREDLLLVYAKGEIDFLENTGNQGFINRGQILEIFGGIRAAEVLDYDGDGWMDLIVGTEQKCLQSEQCVSLFLNQGVQNSGDFPNAESFDLAFTDGGEGGFKQLKNLQKTELALNLNDKKIQQLEAFDLNNDQCEDLILSDNSGYLKIFYNQKSAARCEGLEENPSLAERITEGSPVNFQILVDPESDLPNILIIPLQNEEGILYLLEALGFEENQFQENQENNRLEYRLIEDFVPADQGPELSEEQQELLETLDSSANNNGQISPAASSTLNELTNSLSADHDYNGCVDSWSGSDESALNSGLAAVQKTADIISNLRCTGGGCAPIPYNKAFFAPDDEIPGFAALAFYPSHPSVEGLPLVKPGATDDPILSTYRLYISPTLTLGLGTGICLGPNNLKGQLVPGGPEVPLSPCYVFAVPGGVPGVCQGLNGSLDNALTSAKNSIIDPATGMATVISDGNSHQTRSSDPNDPISYNASANIKVPGFPSSITNWLDNQIDEIYNKLLDFPDITLILPDFSPWYEDNTPRIARDIEFQNFNDFASTIAGLPLIEIEEKEVLVRVPAISPKEYQKYQDQWGYWKSNLEAQLEDRLAFWRCDESPERKQICDQITADIDELINSANRMMDLIDQISGIPAEILAWRELETKYAAQIIDYMDTITEYLNGYITRQQNRLESWLEAGENALRIVKDWQIIIDVVAEYQASCDKCDNDRFSKLGVLLDFFVDIPEPPVVPMPKWPDVVVDLSQIRTGLEITWPKVEFEPEMIVLPDLPEILLPETLPSIDFRIPGFEVPTLPNFQMPDLPDLPELSLPELPDLPRPPQIPEVPDIIVDFAANLRPIFKALCLLKTGVIPVPEGSLATEIETLTQPSVEAVLPFIKQFGVEWPEIEYDYVKEVQVHSYLDFSVESDFIYNTAKEGFDVWNDAVNNSIQQFNDFEAIPQGIYFNDLFEGDVNIEIGGDVSFGVEDFLEMPFVYQKNSDLVADDGLFASVDLVGSVDSLGGNSASEQKLEIFDQDLVNELTVEIENTYAKKDLLAANLDLLAAANSEGIDEDQLIGQIGNEENLSTPPAKGFYIVGDNGVNENVLNYTAELGERVELLYLDVDNDDDQDLVYSLGGDLYLKENYSENREGVLRGEILDTEEILNVESQNLDEDDLTGNSDSDGLGLSVQGFSAPYYSHNSVELVWQGLRDTADFEEGNLGGNSAENSEPNYLEVYEILIGQRRILAVQKDSELLETLENQINEGDFEGAEIVTFSSLEKPKISLELENGNYSAVIFGGLASENTVPSAAILISPQACADEDAPLPAIASDQIRVPIFSEVVIDASNSFDAAGEITGYYLETLEREGVLRNEEVEENEDPEENLVMTNIPAEIWSDTDVRIDSDGDGNPTNDRSNPILKIGPFENEGDFGEHRFLLHVVDQSGNSSKMAIKVDVFAPEITLEDAALNNEGIAQGETIPPVAESPYFLFRKRFTYRFLDGELVKIPEITELRAGETDENGKYLVDDLTTEGVTLVEDAEGNVVAEIDEETGNIGLLDGNLEVVVNPAEYPETNTSLEIQDQDGNTLATVYVVNDQNADVQVETNANFAAEDSFAAGREGIVIVDLDLQDQFPVDLFASNDPKYPGAAMIQKIANSEAEIAVVVEPNGNIQVLDDDLELRQKNNNHLEDFLVIEVLNGSQPIAEIHFLGKKDRISFVSSENLDFSNPQNPLFAELQLQRLSADSEIEELIRKGILDPNSPEFALWFSDADLVTRGEFTEVLLKMLCIVPRPEAYEAFAPDEAYFDLEYDTENLDPSFPYIKEATLLGLVEGYQGEADELGRTPFRPERQISRAEAVKIILEALEMQGVISLESFAVENPGEAWYEDYLIAAQNLNPYLVDGQILTTSSVISADEALLPNEAMSYRELVEMVARVLEVYSCFETDADGDGMSDFCEEQNDIDDPNGDEDNDGLTNAEECNYGLDPNSADTDGGGISDYQEIFLGLNPLYTDDDQGDGGAVSDLLDNLGISDSGEDGADNDGRIGRESDSASDGEISNQEGIYIEPAECNTCPCLSTVSSSAEIQDSDVIFPAIGVYYGDKFSVFSKGNEVEIR